MKANVLLPSLLGLTLLSACAPRASAPAPAPRPVETPAPTPQVVPRPVADWRDAPLTPGGWSWAVVGGRSTARFAATGQAPLVQLTCLTKGTLQLTHAGLVETAVPLGVTTSSGIFPLLSDPAIPGTSGVTVTLSARLPVLDAITYSRGRFVIEVPGQPPSYLPAWPEVARVVEDCR